MTLGTVRFLVVVTKAQTVKEIIENGIFIKIKTSICERQ